MSVVVADFLRSRFEPVAPYDFWRTIFPDGELDSAEAFTEGKFTGIAVEITKDRKANGQPRINRYTVTDELDEVDFLLHSNDFCVMAPISYIGKSRRSENARVMYALCVELDDLKISKSGEQDGLEDLIYQWEGPSNWLPKPTFLVASGSGIHLYYVFDKPLRLYPNVVKGLVKYKRALTKRIWNKYTTNSWKEEDIQFESVFQAFRMPGTVTKNGKDRAEAFVCGDRVSIDYMNQYVSDAERKDGAQIPEAYNSKTSIEKAAELWPDWYQRRIVEGDKSTKKWDIAGKVHGSNPYALYDWWIRNIHAGAHDGNRYYCLWVLVIYAIKCDVPQEKLERDCFELLDMLDSRTKKENNAFTEHDILCALQAYEDSELMTYPLNSIIYKTGIKIEKNKRHKDRGQAKHMEIMTKIRDVLYPDGEWRNKDGAPTAERIVWEWQQKNPYGRKCDCIRETGLSKPTVYKWWNPMP